MRIRILCLSDPGCKNSVPGSGIYIPDPQHCSIILCHCWRIFSIRASETRSTTMLILAKTAQEGPRKSQLFASKLYHGEGIRVLTSHTAEHSGYRRTNCRTTNLGEILYRVVMLPVSRFSLGGVFPPTILSFSTFFCKF
jgi:hypothetical protein